MQTAAAALAPAQDERELASDTAYAGASGARALIRSAQDAPRRLRDEWVGLAGQASEANAFAEIWFVEPGLRHLARADVKMVEVRDGPELIGLLPLTIAGRYGRMPVRHVQNWGHFHSFLGTPLVRAGREQDFWEAVLAALDEAAWASSFLHINGLVEHGPVHRGLAAAAWRAGRSCDTVHRVQRALLASALSPQDYYERTVRKKKRKELKRLQGRLAELGEVAVRRLAPAEELAPWCDAFLALEQAGWKGKAGSALACAADTEAFFRDAIAGAHTAGRLEFLRLDLDGRPLAMLVNFLTPPGGFAFKITFDEEYARFSPGVLLKIDNLRLLERGDIEWMDSCAVEDHAMINSLWGERRAIVRVTVPLAGMRRQITFRLCRAAEKASAALRHHRSTFRAGKTDD
jgi:CelD/BcsL family acetyltransferase involved in cellulose biosynthesis